MSKVRVAWGWRPERDARADLSYWQRAAFDGWRSEQSRRRWKGFALSLLTIFLGHLAWWHWL